MEIEIGQVEAIFRYPVKSMAGERLESAQLGWHGIEGDRRLALCRADDHSGMPWLTASRLPELVRFTPLYRDGAQLPTHVRTPEGDELPVFSEQLAADIARRYGSPVQMIQFKNGIFDETNISVIATETMEEIGRLCGLELDMRRFRPNIVARLLRPGSLQENGWVGGTLVFGEDGEGPEVAVTMRDVRCSMVNLDPDTAKAATEVLKTIVRVNDNQCGIYATVTRTGQLAAGQKIRLRREAA